MHGRDIRASVVVKLLLIRGGFSFKTGGGGQICFDVVTDYAEPGTLEGGARDAERRDEGR